MPIGAPKAVRSHVCSSGKPFRQPNTATEISTPIIPPWLLIPPRWIASNSQKGTLLLNSTNIQGS